MGYEGLVPPVATKAAHSCQDTSQGSARSSGFGSVAVNRLLPSLLRKEQAGCPVAGPGRGRGRAQPGSPRPDGFSQASLATSLRFCWEPRRPGLRPALPGASGLTLTLLSAREWPPGAGAAARAAMERAPLMLGRVPRSPCSRGWEPSGAQPWGSARQRGSLQRSPPVCAAPAGELGTRRPGLAL